MVVRAAYASRRGSFNTKAGGRKRRRTGVISRSYRKRGARAQASQIRTVARTAALNSRMLAQSRCYMDYQQRGSSPTTWVSGTWVVDNLISPASWAKSMRQNTAGNLAQSAYVRNAVLQYVCSLNTMLRSCAVSFFVVSIRKNAVGFVPQTSTMVDGTTYEQIGTLSMPRLNPNIFRVHYAKTFMIMSNGLSGLSITQSATDAVGDPETTFVRGQLNMNLRLPLRSRATFATPATEPKAWSNLTSGEILPSQRRFLMWYQVSGDTSNSPGMFWDVLYTAITQ